MHLCKGSFPKATSKVFCKSVVMPQTDPKSLTSALLQFIVLIALSKFISLPILLKKLCLFMVFLGQVTSKSVDEYLVV